MKKKNIPEKKKNENILSFSDEIVIGINKPKQQKRKKKYSNKYKKNREKKEDKKIKLKNQKLKTKIKEETIERKKNNLKPKTKKLKKVPLKSKTKKREQFSPQFKKIIKMFTIIFLVLGTAIFVMWSPLFSIKQINIIGTKTLTTQIVQNLSQVTIGDNIFGFNKIQSKANIESNPYVEEAFINRILPDKIEIIIKEKTVTFSIVKDNTYIYIDNQGNVLEISKVKKQVPMLTSCATNIAELKPGDRLIKEDLVKLEQVLAIVNAMKNKNLYEKIIEIDIANATNYTIRMQDGKTVHLNDFNNLNGKMSYLQAIFEKEAGIEGDVYIYGKNKEILFRENIRGEELNGND